jgi:ribosomal-protein-alanine N-acetyltransferase
MLYETQRLSVHRVSAEDVDSLLSVVADPVVMQHFAHGRPWSRDELLGFLAQYPEGDPNLVCVPGVVRLKPAGQVIGFGGVGYYKSETTTPDLYYLLARAHWGAGLATELGHAALENAFSHPEVSHVNASAKPVNVASIRVLEKCGLGFVQYIPHAERNWYRITRAEWAARSQL